MVKKLLLGALAVVSLNVSAMEISCDDLQDMANAVDDLVGVIQSGADVREGDEADNALRGLVDALYEVARIENESDLNDYVIAMDNAWHDMDGDQFVYGANGVVGSLDRLYVRDCE